MEIRTHEAGTIWVHKDSSILHSLDGLTTPRLASQEKRHPIVKVRVIVYLNFGFERLAMEHVCSPRSDGLVQSFQAKKIEGCLELRKNQCY